MGAVKRVGVLALQGDFEAHKRALARVGAEAVEVRTAAHLDDVDGLILPGGESTTMLKLLEEENLFEPLRHYGRQRPIFGTCAGAILLANEVLNPSQKSLGLMDMTVERNAYGRQLDSRIVLLESDILQNECNREFEAVFIRAPIIRRIGRTVSELTTYDGTPVVVLDGKHLAVTFHPELTQDSRIHHFFVDRLTHTH